MNCARPGHSADLLLQPIPAGFGIDDYFFCYERHFVCSRRLSNGDIGIVTIPRARVHQIEGFREDSGL
jgi:hypothetical protein